MPATNPTKVIVGMSGGVDSSVAAHLLKRQGYDVEGLFMKNWEEDDGTEYCTARADHDDAARVAAALHIPLHTANFAAEYWDNVFERFLEGYARGHTPNPDVLCNREIKFNLFLDYARALGADRIATGHYARARRDRGTFELLRANDENKDQTYFLQAVPAAQLEPCLFPLGELCKSDVRRLARAQGIHVHEKKDSTGICFIGERRFRDFLTRYIAGTPGDIVTTEGRVVGRHAGLAHYTPGQRQGLGIGGQSRTREAPWYVADKDRRRNELIVTQDAEDLVSDWLSTPTVNWVSGERTLPFTCEARIRHRQRLQSVRVQHRADGTVLVRFHSPQRAIAPGQYVCLYDGEVCLGGGVIDRHGRAPAGMA